MKTKGEKMLMRFEYDFAKDGGAVGEIELRQASGQKFSGAEAVVNAYVIVEDAITSSGTPTITFGDNNDADGFFIDTYALLAANKAVMAGQVAGALIFDDTNDVLKVYRPAANEVIKMEVGTAALTAGKLALYLEVLA